VQLVNPRGSVCLASDETKSLPVDGTVRKLATSGHGSYRTDMHIGSTHLRVLTDGVGHYGALEVALPLKDVDSALSSQLLLMVVIAAVGIALAALLGILVARTALTPITRFTRRTETIAANPERLEQRLEVTGRDELARLAQTFNATLDALERSVDAQRNLVADASHELRTPLTSVLANLELLADTLHGDQGDAARSALRSSQRMRRLVADLLLLARTDVGRIVRRERCDLAQVVVEAAGELGPVSVDHEIVLDVHPAIVKAARDELHRLTINLLENALRHTPPGTKIRVWTETAGGQVTLVVQDDGPGVPPELVPTIFERFVRGAGDSGGSFGLGLAIVQAVAESHGGSVALESSAEGTGARFIVRLPAASDLHDDGQYHRPPLQTVID
jgi:signal transduction histidine kinase